MCPEYQGTVGLQRTVRSVRSVCLSAMSDVILVNSDTRSLTLEMFAMTFFNFSRVQMAETIQMC